MRRIAALFLAIASIAAWPVHARETVVEEVIWVDEDGNEVPPPPGETNTRFVETPAAAAALPRGIASYGPFRLIDESRAALVGVTDSRSPAAFAALLAAHPAVRTLELVDCPGTEDDRANLQLGRMIRTRGIATHVPAGGSVRSGAVELFLGGVRHTADAGAEFAVHAWADSDGLGPADYAASAPENRAYIAYYREMGMSGIEAQAFYAMTNSAPFEHPRWLSAAQMGQWVALR